MQHVIDLIPWENLQGALPTIFQGIGPGGPEILAVQNTKKPVFEDLLQHQFLELKYDSQGCPDCIVQDLRMDCDTDCLLVKVTASDELRNQHRKHFHPLENEVPSSLFKRSRLMLAVTQDWQRGDVLMAAFMDEEALRLTLSTRFLHYFSRKRGKWKKGEESGNVQHLMDGRFDEKANALVFSIRQEGGAACHDGYRSCFYRMIEINGSLTIVGERVFDPKTVYGKKGN